MSRFRDDGERGATVIHRRRNAMLPAETHTLLAVRDAGDGSAVLCAWQRAERLRQFCRRRHLTRTATGGLVPVGRLKDLGFPAHWRTPVSG